MNHARIVPHGSQEQLAQETSRRIIAVLEQAQDERGEATLVLTGGSMGNKVIQAVANDPDAALVDWSRVNIWWSDERFVPGADSERNGVQAADAAQGQLDLEWDRIHPIAASDEMATAEEAAADYREELATAAQQEGADGELPRFDLMLLSLGPDTHVASLFPGRSEVTVANTPVMAVNDSPKPPPTRVTMSLPAINSADRVWLLVAGSAKAEALAAIRDPEATPQSAPGSAVRGTEETLLLVTEDALPGLPQDPEG